MLGVPPPPHRVRSTSSHRTRCPRGYALLPALGFLALGACGDSLHLTGYDDDGEGLVFHVAEASLQVGESMDMEVFLARRDQGPVKQLGPSEVEWTVSDPGVVTVNSGTVTAEGTGEAIVAAEDAQGRRARAQLTVEPADTENPGEGGGGLPLIAEGPHDAEPSSGREGWTGGWRAPSFRHARVVKDTGASAPFDAYIRTRYPSGMRDGSGPVHWYGWHEDGPFTELRHVRIQKWIRIGGDRSDFESHPVGTKMGFMGAGACSGARAELYPLLEGGLRSSFSIRILQQFLDRKVMGQNVTNERVIQAGEWQKWEYELILNDVGQSNGVMRLEVDGQLLIDYDDVKYRNGSHPCGLQVWRWNPTWGGSSNAVKSREDHIDIAEVKIWGERL